MRTNLDNIRGKNVLIVGLGKSGTVTCQTMLDMGAIVSVQDRRGEREFDPSFLNYLKGKGVTCYFDDTPDDMGKFDMIIMSPGASPELPFVQEGARKGAEITGELEIAFRASKGNFVAITGTNGKTTTTTLVGEIFKEAGRKTYVVGNIGNVALTEAMKAGEQDWLITEASSFQLETTKYFKPVISAILNLTPDHLNRHHTMKAYGEAKAKIFANQSKDGYLIVNKDDKECLALTKNAKATIVPFSRKKELDFGAFVRNDAIIVKDGKKEIEICNISEMNIIGDHNVENALAAAAISYFAGIDPKTIGKVIRSFSGVEHRLEYCGTLDGVRYYNDSKGTNVDATITAIKAIKKNIILVAGGDGKGQDFQPLIKAFGKGVKKVVLLGKDGPAIAKAADKENYKDYVFCKDMPECVRKAAELAEEGDNVLLSPACASWDMYDNYEQRGEHFKDCVEMLSK